MIGSHILKQTKAPNLMAMTGEPWELENLAFEQVWYAFSFFFSFFSTALSLKKHKK